MHFTTGSFQKKKLWNWGNRIHGEKENRWRSKNIDLDYHYFTAVKVESRQACVLRADCCHNCTEVNGKDKHLFQQLPKLSGISQNGRAGVVLPRAFSCGELNGKSKSKGDLPSPEHRVAVSAQCNFLTKNKGEEKLGSGLRGLGKGEDTCFIS